MDNSIKDRGIGKRLLLLIVILTLIIFMIHLATLIILISINNQLIEIPLLGISGRSAVILFYITLVLTDILILIILIGTRAFPERLVTKGIILLITSIYTLNLPLLASLLLLWYRGRR